MPRPTLWKITYEYTTSTISGYVSSEPEFFDSEDKALERYQSLRTNGLGDPPNTVGSRSVNTRTVELWYIVGWRLLLPGRCS